jgi:hypothetical protein
MRNILASILAVAALAAITTTQASAWCGGEGGAYYGYTAYNEYTPDYSYEGERDHDFERFGHRGFERHDRGGSFGGHRHR